MNDSKKFALQLIKGKKLKPDWYTIQDLLLHCEKVIEYSMRLSDGNYNKIIEIAGWLHDLGRTISDEDHSEDSFNLCKDFIESLKLSKEEYLAVKDCILNHGIGKSPETRVGKIFQCADRIAKLDVAVMKNYRKRVANSSSKQKVNEKTKLLISNTRKKIVELRFEPGIKLADKLIDNLNLEFNLL